MPSQTNQADTRHHCSEMCCFSCPHADNACLPVLILSSAGPSVSCEKWYQEQRHQPLTVSLRCLDLRNENLGVSVSRQRLC